jgi:hypothetical protein
MPELSPFDLRSAALPVTDYQVDTLAQFMSAALSADLLPGWQAEDHVAALAAARTPAPAPGLPPWRRGALYVAPKRRRD